jgi:hypothetical protein
MDWNHLAHDLNRFQAILNTVLNLNLDNDQLDAHLLYFTLRPLKSSTCFEHYMLIIKRFELY